MLRAEGRSGQTSTGYLGEVLFELTLKKRRVRGRGRREGILWMLSMSTVSRFCVDHLCSW